MNYIYMDSEIAIPGGRHRVVVDPTTGACDLMIASVIEDDAGRYICSEATTEIKTYTELIVLTGTQI